MEEGFDYDGHFRWFARELKHEPNPRRLFQDAFNAAPLETILGTARSTCSSFTSARASARSSPAASIPPR